MPSRQRNSGERHLHEALGAVDVLAADGAEFDAEATRLAARFHECVYNVAAADNEEQSAQIARGVVGTSALPDEVSRLVLMTLTHKCEPDDGNVQN